MIFFKKHIMVLMIFFLFVFGVVASFLQYPKTDPPNHFPELVDVNGKNLSFPELNTYFTKLAQNKGAAYAFEVLKVAQLPPNTDMHLLGHAVGDVLFKQKGAAGMTICTQDFRNACSHSVVVGLFIRDGEGALPQIAEACRKAPGGTGAYTMCFHGLGHGILAALDYDLGKTALECQKTSTAQYGFQEGSECVGGAVMEIIGGGFHNQKLWQQQRPKYLIPANPLSPCDTDIVPEGSKYMCYTYLTPWFMELAGVDPVQISIEAYRKAFSYCDRIPISQEGYRKACYGGFGKEFIVLVPGRDIRKIEQLSDAELSRVHELCAAASDTFGISACVISASNSLYWGGENDYTVAIQFCALAKDANIQTACFTNLIGAVQYYSRDRAYKSTFCTALPIAYQDQCNRVIRLE